MPRGCPGSRGPPDAPRGAASSGAAPLLCSQRRVASGFPLLRLNPRVLSNFDTFFGFDLASSGRPAGSPAPLSPAWLVAEDCCRLDPHASQAVAWNRRTGLLSASQTIELCTARVQDAESDQQAYKAGWARSRHLRGVVERTRGARPAAVLLRRVSRRRHRLWRHPAVLLRLRVAITLLGTSTTMFHFTRPRPDRQFCRPFHQEDGARKTCQLPRATVSSSTSMKITSVGC